MHEPLPISMAAFAVWGQMPCIMWMRLGVGANFFSFHLLYRIGLITNNFLRFFANSRSLQFDFCVNDFLLAKRTRFHKKVTKSMDLNFHFDVLLIGAEINSIARHFPTKKKNDFFPLSFRTIKEKYLIYWLVNR